MTSDESPRAAVHLEPGSMGTDSISPTTSRNNSPRAGNLKLAGPDSLSPQSSNSSITAKLHMKPGSMATDAVSPHSSTYAPRMAVSSIPGDNDEGPEYDREQVTHIWQQTGS